MTDQHRLEDLRRRVQKDPASIAFAQLAEELRRSGVLQEAVDVSVAGLAIHPSYLSARVTLGRALLDLDRLDEAQTELERVLAGAPENLAARRGLGEIFTRRGILDVALVHYRAALTLAPNDPDLELTVADLSGRLESRRADGASVEVQPKHPAVEQSDPAPVDAIVQIVVAENDLPAVGESRLMSIDQSNPLMADGPSPGPADAVSFATSPALGSQDPAHRQARRTVVALEGWLDAIHVSRANRRA